MKRILLTGHLGLIGRHLQPLLVGLGYEIFPFDVRDKSGDILDETSVSNALGECDGVVHLAAVSRVVWAEKDPDLCWATNAVASTKMIHAAIKGQRRPWIIAASSREVYGQAQNLPVSEDTPLAPVNVYGRSKVELERAITLAQATGLIAATVRLSNVYGCQFDHKDRVIPAFCMAAIHGEPLRVDGEDTLFDFTHVSDVARGIAMLVQKLENTGKSLPQIHFVTGQGTSLLDAARIAVLAAKSDSSINLSKPRSYDVRKFCGNPSRAQTLLGWRPRTSLSAGIMGLVEELRCSKHTEIKRGNETQRN